MTFSSAHNYESNLHWERLVARIITEIKTFTYRKGLKELGTPLNLSKENKASKWSWSLAIPGEGQSKNTPLHVHHTLNFLFYTSQKQKPPTKESQF